MTVWALTGDSFVQSCARRCTAATDLPSGNEIKQPHGRLQSPEQTKPAQRHQHSPGERHLKNFQQHVAWITPSSPTWAARFRRPIPWPTHIPAAASLRDLQVLRQEFLLLSPSPGPLSRYFHGQTTPLCSGELLSPSLAGTLG